MENQITAKEAGTYVLKFLFPAILLLVLMCGLPATGRAGPATPGGPERADGAAGAGENSLSVEEGKVLVNLVDAELVVLVKFISDLTGDSFIYDERLKGRVTIYSPDKLSKDEAFNLFVSVLEFKGFTIVSTGNIYKVIPLSLLKGENFEVRSEKEAFRADERYVARVIPLEFINPSAVVALIRPLVSKNAFVAPFHESNAVLILDTSLNIKKVLKIVRRVDVARSKTPPELVFLKYAEPASVIEVLQGMKVGGGGRASSPKGVGGGVSARGGTPLPVANERLNAIIIYGSEAEKKRIRQFVSLIDVQTPQTKSGINVYHLENADAEEVAKVLSDLDVLEAGGKKAAKGGRGPGVPVKPMQAMARIGGEITVTPYSPTNSLIIQASPDDYLSLVEIIKALDKRPKQVFVEAMIMEVSINKALNAGTKWRVMSEHNNKPIAIGGVGNIDVSTIDDIFTGLAGLTIGGITNFMTVPVTQPDGSVIDISVPGLAGLFTLEDFKDVINVLSTPHILTSDNKEAEIIVGENVPFLSQFERESGLADQPVLQSIERKDVGITLRITPQISDGGYVKLDIYQEISAVAPTALAGGAEASDIITTKRSAKTSVVVKDGQRIVIGGLIQEKKSDNVTKVPLLGDIPILGYLFKHRSNKKERTNLIVFLTPTIINDFDDLDRLREAKELVFSQAMDLKKEIGNRVKEKEKEESRNKSIEEDEDGLW